MSFDKIPTKLDNLINEVQYLKELITENQLAKNLSNEWFTLIELIQYLPNKPAKATIYGKVTRKEIPFYKKGKHLYFKKSEIDEWLLSGKITTKAEEDKNAIKDFARRNATRK
jgi:excisionase family DNA binding protein